MPRTAGGSIWLTEKTPNRMLTGLGPDARRSHQPNDMRPKERNRKLIKARRKASAKQRRKK